MKTQLTTLRDESRTEPGRKAVLALLVPLLWATALSLPALDAQAAVVLATLHSFTGATNDGANPYAGLVQSSDGNLYGTTEAGGAYINQNGEGCGTVFKLSTNGALSALYYFTGGNDGNGPSAGLVQGSDGSFYGTTGSGGKSGFGINGAGTVFKISTNGTLTSLYSFTGGNDGANPSAALVQGNDGYFYGTTQNGGTNNFGTVFKISTNGALTTLHVFTDGSDGGYPYAGLVQGTEGSFYGTTSEGGTIDAGTVFKITTNGALTSLYSFTNGNDGNGPSAGLVQGSDGYFYGTASSGGAVDGVGTVFKININGALTTLYNFGGLTNGDGAYPLDGANPVGGLVEGSDGYFYGTTEYGGTFTYFVPPHGWHAPHGGWVSFGTVFQISTNGVLTTLYDFGSITNASGFALGGANPFAGLVQGRDGSFYGTTPVGGTNNQGTVFRVTIVPEFQAVTLTNSTLSLNWSTEAGGTYQLQYNSDLSSTNWTNLGSPVTATGATLSTTDSLNNAPQRFYRLVLSP
jgi:uncharacterized repeat protein (TIGR03803 family)